MRIKTDRFTYSKKTRTFIAFASDLEEGLADTFELESALTGDVQTFYLFTEIKDETEGETVAWVWKPERFSHLWNMGVLVKVFND